MKPWLVIAIFMISCITLAAQQRTLADQHPENQVRKYWFVMLLKGNNRTQDSATAAKIQEDHLANIHKLYEEGKLKVAGPFGDDGNWLGIFIFDCASKENAEKLLQTDPAIISGRLTYDIRPWYTAPIGSFVPGKP
jgi:uncharacterized protein YciI